MPVAQGTLLRRLDVSTQITSGRMNNRQVLRRVVYSLVTLVAVGISQAQAGAIAINFFSVGFSSAHGAIWTPFGPAPIGMSDGRSSGPRLGPTAASASLTHPATGFHVDASARTSRAVGVDVH